MRANASRLNLSRVAFLSDARRFRCADIRCHRKCGRRFNTRGTCTKRSHFGRLSAPASPGPAPRRAASAPDSGDRSTLTVAKLQTRGETAVNKLNDAISQDVPDKNVADFKHNYRETSGPGRATPDLGRILIPLGKDPRSNSYSECTVVNNVGGDPANPILQLKVSSEEGIMIIEVSYANRDKLPDAQKIRWSDQVFRLWQEHGDNAQLNLVIRRNIQNKATNNAISQFHAAHKIGRNKAGTWLPGSDEYNALIGSDNGRPIAYMLQDHHQTLGDKRVTSIVTYAQNPRSYMALNIG